MANRSGEALADNIAGIKSAQAIDLSSADVTLAGVDTSTNINLLVQFAAGVVISDIIFGRPYIRKIPGTL